MDYRSFTERMRSFSRLARVTTYGTVVEGRRRYPVLRLDTTGHPRVLITAGFHGEEPAGPLTLALHLPRIVRYAAKKGVGLTVFPCINPSGFEAGTRYNASGERPNNDFLRYVLDDGSVVGELYGRQPSFRRYRLFKQSPQETRLVQRALERVRTPAAALDLHQDDYMRSEAAYAYVFGEARHYLAIARRCARLMPLAAKMQVDPRLRTDAHGFIWFHDGSVTDWFMRRGTEYCATVETTTSAPLTDCAAVNLVWVKGFIDLASRRKRRP